MCAPAVYSHSRVVGCARPSETEGHPQREDGCARRGYGISHSWKSLILTEAEARSVRGTADRRKIHFTCLALLVYSERERERERPQIYLHESGTPF